MNLPPPPHTPSPLRTHQRSRALPVLAALGALVGALVVVFALTYEGEEDEVFTEREQAVLLTLAIGNEDAARMIEDGDGRELLDSTRALADSICGLAQEANSWDEMGTLTGLTYASQREVSELFDSSDSFARYVSAAIDWRCPSFAASWS